MPGALSVAQSMQPEGLANYCWWKCSGTDRDPDAATQAGWLAELSKKLQWRFPLGRCQRFFGGQHFLTQFETSEIR